MWPRIGKRSSKNLKAQTNLCVNLIASNREFCLTKDPVGKTNTHVTHGRQYLQCLNGQVINGKVPQNYEGSYENCTANVILNGEKKKSFPLRSGTT